MNFCAICTKEATHEFETIDGPIGWVCDDSECGRILWDGHLNDFIGATAEERAQQKWRVAQKRKLMAGQSISPTVKSISDRISRIELRLVEIHKQAEASGRPLALDFEERQQLDDVLKKYEP